MDTKLATNTICRQSWAAIINDRLESGLSFVNVKLRAFNVNGI